jgi:hypothetical protein
MRKPGAPSLRHAAQRATQHPFFLARPLLAYQAAHNLNDRALAAFLGCAPDDLPRLALCRRPRAAPPEFRADLAHLAARFHIRTEQLANLLREVDALQSIRRQSAQTQGAQRMLRAARDRDDEPETPTEDV